MNNKEKILIGTISFIVGTAVGFLLAPIKNKVSFERFSCGSFTSSEVNSSLDSSEEGNVENIDNDEEKEHIKE